MFNHILFPVDLFHARSWWHALPVALELADKFSSKLHIMTCIPDSGMAIVNQYFSKDAVNKVVEETNEALHKFVEENIPSKYTVQHIVTTGNVYESIIRTAQKIDCDLIVISAHRPDIKDYLLGRNSAKVVRHSDRSVLVVRE